jgi:hypothetical protein
MNTATSNHAARAEGVRGMSNKRLLEVFDNIFPAVFGLLFVAALLVLIGGVITAIHFISKWW